MIARPAIDAELRRLLVDLERPAALDEWRQSRRHEAPNTAHYGAVRVIDKYGNLLKEAA